MQLGIDAPIVCNSGAIVKEPLDHQTLWRADLDVELLAEIVRIFREHDEPIVSFTDNPPDGPDFLVEHEATGRPFFDDYLDQNRRHAAVVPNWPAGHGAAVAHFHVCAIGGRPTMHRLESAVVERLGERVRTFVQKSPRYLGTMCEVIRADASKWSAVLHVAEQWNVAPEEICAVGDDMNDLPMIAGAGLGVAMAHAPEPVRAAADLVAEFDPADPDPDPDGVAWVVNQMLR